MAPRRSAAPRAGAAAAAVRWDLIVLPAVVLAAVDSVSRLLVDDGPGALRGRGAARG